MRKPRNIRVDLDLQSVAQAAALPEGAPGQVLLYRASAGAIMCPMAIPAEHNLAFRWVGREPWWTKGTLPFFIAPGMNSRPKAAPPTRPKAKASPAPPATRSPADDEDEDDDDEETSRRDDDEKEDEGEGPGEEEERADDPVQEEEEVERT